MKLAAVGKPSSGKTTFLNAACMTQAEVGEYPFTTIKPNFGTTYVRVQCACTEKDKRCGNCIDGIRLVPVQMIDVAGLVPGAHEGKGMGNAFLSDAMDADALIHVVDASGTTDEKGNKTTGHDPVKDIEFLEEEIEEWLAGILEKSWAVIKRKVEMKQAKLGDEVYAQISGLNMPRQGVEAAIRKTQDLHELAREIRRQCKPIVVAANKIDLPGAPENAARMDCIPCCSEAELALRKAKGQGLVSYVPGDKSFEYTKEVSGKQKKALDFIAKLMKKNGENGTGVQQVINHTVFGVLDFIVAYPVEDEHKWMDKKGRVLPDAFLLKRGSTALDLAYKVHSDIGEKFIGAVDGRTHKRIGRDYVLKGNDVIRILV